MFGLIRKDKLEHFMYEAKQNKLIAQTVSWACKDGEDSLEAKKYSKAYMDGMESMIDLICFYFDIDEERKWENKYCHYGFIPIDSPEKVHHYCTGIGKPMCAVCKKHQDE